jgi:catechol 2,3-dioxygenase-like lactoylglutathione lyase family enzyme
MTRPRLDGISPSFIVSDIEQSIAFYRDKLGFETRFLQPEKETSPPFLTTHGIAT